MKNRTLCCHRTFSCGTFWELENQRNTPVKPQDCAEVQFHTPHYTLEAIGRQGVFSSAGLLLACSVTVGQV